ncbi:hypothetical protein D3C77_258300 [compost metagenome]
MVRPNHEAEEGNQDGREYHGAISEQALPRESTHDLGNNSECRQDQDINFRVPEDPKYMLPQNRVTPACYVKEVSSQNPIEAEKYQANRDSRESKQNHG